MQNSASTIKQNTEEIGIEGHQFCDLATAEVGYNQAGNWEDGITIPICRPTICERCSFMPLILKLGSPIRHLLA
jgi:hypothetical protein